MNNIRTFLKMRNPNTTRKELFEIGVWTTADGRRIHVSKLSDDHLSNITGYLFRSARVNAKRLAEFGYVVPIMRLYKSHPFTQHIKNEFARRNR